MIENIFQIKTWKEALKEAEESKYSYKPNVKMS